jgi:hypothetical protein
LPADLRAALPALIADARMRCGPADEMKLASELTQTLSMLGGPMSHAERIEWQVSMQDDLRDIPGDLAIEGVRDARRTCRRREEVLPHVREYAEDYPARRRAQLQRLMTLATVAGVLA